MPVLPRTIPAYESMLIGGNKLPSSLVLALKSDRNDLYDLRDQLVNLFVDDETPNGPQNGTNKNFTLASAPQPPQSLELYRNGSLLIFGVDYNLIGSSLALAVAPVSTDILVAFYRTRRGLPAPSSLAIPPAAPTGGGGGFTSGLWTQVGIFLYPTAFSTETILTGMTSTDLTTTPGYIVSLGAHVIVTGSTNASFLAMAVTAGTETTLSSAHTGTGTDLPLSIYTAGSRRATVLTTGDLLVGFFSSDASGGPGRILANTLIGVLSSSANSPYIFIQANSGGVENTLQSTKTGTGTALPLSFYVSPTGRAVTILTTGDLLCGFFSSDASGGTGRILANTLVGVLSASANSPYIFMQANTGGVENILESTRTGTGAQLPLSFYVAPTGRVATFTTGGQFFFLRFASAGVGATMQLTGNFEASALNNAFGFDGTTANATATAILAFQGIQIQSTGAANLSFLSFQCDTSNNLSQITSSHIGTGTNLPLTFNTGSGETARMTTNNVVLVGITSTDLTTSAGMIISLSNQTVVTATTNASFLSMGITAGTETTLSSAHTGTGTDLPLSIYVAGARKFTFTAGGALVAGNLTPGSYGDAASGRILTPGDFLATTGFTANESFGRLLIVNGNVTLESGRIGTGTNLPLTFSMFNLGEAARFTTGLSLFIGTTSTDATVTNPSVFLKGAGSYNIITAATNASVWFVSINAGTRINLASSSTGTGTVLPMTVFIGSAASTFDTAGAFICGATSSDITAAGRIISVGGTGILGVASAATNSSFFVMQVNATDARLTSNAFVTILPMTFFIGSTEIMRLPATANKVFINRTTDDGTGAFLQVVGGISVGGVLLTVP